MDSNCSGIAMKDVEVKKFFFILKNEFAEAEKTIYKCLKLTEATG